MSWQYYAQSRNLLERRRERKQRLSRLQPHPLAHVDQDRRHDWMREDCAAYNTARQAREDAIITTITQISSAALLAIPGILFGANKDFPTFHQKPSLYLGIVLFFISLVFSMIEQYISAKACRHQVKIAEAFYTMESEVRDDSKLIPWVRRSRNIACIVFGVAIVITASSLITLERTGNGNSAAPATAPTTASSATT